MSRESLVFLIGIALVLVPSLGVPSQWKTIFFYAAGVILIVVGYSLRRAAYLRSIEHENGERKTDSYEESAGAPRRTKQPEAHEIEV